MTGTARLAYIGTRKKCGPCQLKIAVHRRGPFRYLAIHMNEAARQRARDLWTTPEFEYAQRQRKKVEALFAELKCRIGLHRLRLRRLKFVQEQFFLAATAQNIKRLVRFLSWTDNIPDTCHCIQAMVVPPRSKNTVSPESQKTRRLFQHPQVESLIESFRSVSDVGELAESPAIRNLTTTDFRNRLLFLLIYETQMRENTAKLMAYILALDQGTTSSRAILFDQRRRHSRPGSA